MDNQLVVSNGQSAIVYDDSRVDLIKRTIAKGATDDELQMFLAQCQRTGLDPFMRQIYMRKQWDSKLGREVATTGIAIDGFRLIAERSQRYGGQLGPFWCGRDGKWVDVWLESGPPAAAKIGVIRTDFREPLWAVAKYDEYVQTKKDGQPNSMWVKMPANQLAKCAESLALRKAFPQDLSGLYTAEEMAQANVIEGDYNTSATYTPNEPTQRQPEPAAAKPTTETKHMPTKAMMNKLHALGVQKFGPEWDDARHELVGKLTEGRTRSSTDLDYAEVVKLAETIKTFNDYIEPLFDEEGGLEA